MLTLVAATAARLSDRGCPLIAAVCGTCVAQWRLQIRSLVLSVR